MTPLEVHISPVQEIALKFLDDLITEKLVEAYEMGGQRAVEDLCFELGITQRCYCEPCEAVTPLYKNCCAVCFTFANL